MRAAEIGISVRDLDLLSVGMLFDIFTEKSLDMDMLTPEDSGEREATEAEVADFVDNF